MNYEPRELNDAADLCEQWRQGALTEIGQVPQSRVHLDAAETALLAARDLLRTAARASAYYLTLRNAPDMR